MNLRNFNLPFTDRSIFLSFGIITIITIAWAILKETVIPLCVPFLIILGLLLVTNYQIVYYLLLICLPFSMSFGLPGGLTLDLPTEPLMVVVMGCFLGSLLLGAKPEKGFYQHPIVILTTLMYVWGITSTFFSVDTTKSIKFLLAKAWYIAPFLLFTGTVIKNISDFRRIIWCFLIPLFLLVLVVLFKHMLLNFSFATVQASVEPFFRNHVIYSATVALIVPYIFTLITLESKAIKTLLFFILILTLISIGFSYTRASWLSLPIAALYYLTLRLRISHLAVMGAYIGGFIALGYFAYQNNFMIYAPDYEKTVFNKGDIGGHLEATYKFEDVSGMERVYRWVAAINMAIDKPIFGSGPSTFYPEYKKHTVSSFKTYVSDNPEKSTTHNYFLLQLAEQGVVGLFLFLILIAYILILPQQIYHRTRNQAYRAITMGAAGCLMVIIFHLLLNELIEVDKIGSFFFISMAVLIKIDLWTRKEKQQALLETAGE